MGKMKLLLDVIGDLRSLATVMQQWKWQQMRRGGGNRETRKGGWKKSHSKESKDCGKAGAGRNPLTLEEVCGGLSEKTRAGHTEEVRALLNKHGADKLSEIYPAEGLEFYDEEMEECACGYAEYALSLVEEAGKTCKDPEVLIEQRLDFSRYVEEGFGTGDCVIIADGTLYIIDYKHG